MKKLIFLAFLVSASVGFSQTIDTGITDTSKPAPLVRPGTYLYRMDDTWILVVEPDKVYGFGGLPDFGSNPTALNYYIMLNGQQKNIWLEMIWVEDPKELIELFQLKNMMND